MVLHTTLKLEHLLEFAKLFTQVWSYNSLWTFLTLFIDVIYILSLGYASTIYSVNQVIEILDYIGQKSKSDDILPFAVRLVEGI